MRAVTARGWLPTAGLGAALVVLAVVPYAGVLDHPFSLFDDDVVVTANPAVLAGLTPGSIAWAFTTFHGGNWIPLTWLSHMLDVTLFGPDPRGPHAVSLALHAANALLLFLLLLRATGERWPAFAVAALFGLHPLHVESVAWIAERKDVLAGLFFFLTLHAWLGWVRRPTPGRRLLAVALFGAGLLSKPMLVTLPFVLLLWDGWPLRRLAPFATDPRTAVPLPRLVGEKGFLFALSAASCVVTVWAQRAGGAVVGLAERPLADRLAEAALAFFRYAGKALWPARLAVHYPHDAAMPPGLAVAAVAGLAAVTAGAVALARRTPFVTVGWLWFAGMLVPVIGLVQVGDQSLADRYTYLPLVGLFIAAAWSVARTVAGRPALRPVAAAMTAAVLVALGIATRAQVARWASDLSLFEQAVANAPGSAVSENNLGLALLREGRVDEAIGHYREALRLEPEDTWSRRNLASALLQQGRSAEALAEAEAVLERLPGDAETLFRAGQALQRLGRTDEAIARYAAAIRARPDFGEAYNNLGNLFVSLGRTDEAIARYRSGVAAAPGNATVRYNLARLLARQGRTEEAAALLRDALRLRPDFPEAQRALQEISGSPR